MTLYRLHALLLVICVQFAAAAFADSATGRHRVGILNPQGGTPSMEEGLLKGLRKLGYEESRNTVIEWARAAATPEQMRAQATQLANADVEIIVALGTPATRAALEGSTKPVVFVVGDPVGSGFAASLARPGGNATGVSVLTTELNKKRLEILRKVAPRARVFGYLHNSANPLQAQNLSDMESAARVLGLQLLVLDGKTSDDLEGALRNVRRGRIDALLTSADLTLLSNKARIARAVHDARIPAMFPLREYHEAEVLMTYGPDMDEAMYRAATYVDRVLRGAKPSELPIEQISTYELVINLRLAREMRITVPEDLLVRADEVIR